MQIYHAQKTILQKEIDLIQKVNKKLEKVYQKEKAKRMESLDKKMTKKRTNRFAAFEEKIATMKTKRLTQENN